MSNWKRWPGALLNEQFANVEHPDRIVYPNLRDGSPFVLACDHSGEHAQTEFRVLSFLATTYKAIEKWEPLRSAVRKRYLADGRRMSFKALNESQRIKALDGFVEAASRLNGVLICIGVEKGLSFPKDNCPPRQHEWSPDSLDKLTEICVCGSALVNGLRGARQGVHWITDDDSTVSNERAKADALTMMHGFIRAYPGEQLDLGLGIASQFNDDLRAEDLVAIPDLAAGAFSESLIATGKANLPTSELGPSEPALFLQAKSTIINAWRSNNRRPLKHMNALIRPAEGGKMIVSTGSNYVRSLRPGESADGAPVLNSKWRRALEDYLREQGVNLDDLAG